MLNIGDLTNIGNWVQSCISWHRQWYKLPSDANDHSSHPSSLELEVQVTCLWKPRALTRKDLLAFSFRQHPPFYFHIRNTQELMAFSCYLLCSLSEIEELQPIVCFMKFNCIKKMMICQKKCLNIVINLNVDD